MFKKMILFFIGVIFFSLSNLTYADVVINEVQLSPTAERFLELYNTSDSSVDLTGWYMQRKTATTSSFGSLVSNPNFEGKTIGAHDYFVISRNPLSNSDIVLDSLTLTESNTIQIKNSSQEVVDKIGWGDGCDNPCASNPIDGKSIERDQDGSLLIGTPTPGIQNSDNSDNSDTAQGSANDSNNSNISVASFSTQNTTEIKPKVNIVPAIKAKISANSLAFTGQPLEMETNVSGFSNENIVLGRAYWNFGDGSSLEQINNFEKFFHTYYYLGEYVVFLEYYKNSFSKTPETTTKMIIKVIPTTVIISKVGDVKDFFIELLNNASSDMDISNWVINANGKIFVLPKNSVIISKNSMTISGKITGFTYGDRYNLKLFSSTGEIIFNYSASTVPTVSAKIAVQPKISPVVVQPLERVTPILGEEIPVENLEASVIESDVTKDNPIRTYFLTTILTVFLGISAITVYFIRQKRVITKAGDDFNILDE